MAGAYPYPNLITRTIEVVVATPIQLMSPHLATAGANPSPYTLFLIISTLFSPFDPF